MIRQITRIVLAAALVFGLSIPALPTSVDVIDNFGRAFGGELVTGGGVEPLCYPDGTGDIGTEPPSADPGPQVLVDHDLMAIYALYAALTPDHITRMTGQPRTNVWTDGTVDPQAYAQGAMVTAFYMPMPYNGEAGLGFATTAKREGRDPFNDPSRPNVPFNDATDAYRALDGAFARLMAEGGSFVVVDTNAIFVFLDQFAYIVIPWSEVGGIEEFLMHIFGDSYFDVIGEVGAPHMPIALTSLPSYQFVPGADPAVPGSPPPTTGTSSTTTSSTTTTTTTTAPTSTTEATLPGGGNLQGGSFAQRIWIPLIIGGVLVGVTGLTIYYRTRERPKPGSRVVAGSGGPRVVGLDLDQGDDPRDLPPPALYGEDIPPNQCDWALYFDDGRQGPVALRRATNGHECCVYRITVTTEVIEHEQTARGRQDTGPDRLQIPWYDYSWSNLDVVTETAARSGPAGDLSWMQGLGSSALPNSGSSGGFGAEAPEVAAHLAHREMTVIQCVLEPGCPEYENIYELGGTAYLWMSAAQECTNSATDDGCPVELETNASYTAELSGDLTASVWLGNIADGDEREDNPAGRRPFELSHGHDAGLGREHPSYQHDIKQDDLATVHADATQVQAYSSALADAGITVPEAVWGTTERVTAALRGELMFEVDIAGEMTPKNCEANGCGGHGVCLCRPEFTLHIDVDRAEVIVDGETHDIFREPADADVADPPTPGPEKWVLTGPPI